MHESPSAKQGSIRLLHATSKPHKQSNISDVVEKCKKHIRGRKDDHVIARIGCSFEAVKESLGRRKVPREAYSSSSSSSLACTEICQR